MSQSLEALGSRLMIRTLVIAVVMAAFCWWQTPTFLPNLLGGVLLAFFFQWSLLRNARTPFHKGQVVFSLTRMVLLAYGILVAGQFRPTEISVVICGFLSYKIAWMLEYVLQALPAFQTQKS